MTQREYYTYKRDAEDARHILEQHTQLPYELRKNHNGWYPVVKNGYENRTEDGYSVEVGDTVYDRYNNAYTVSEICVGESSLQLAVVPTDTNEYHKDKNVREGILWVVDKLPIEIAAYIQGTAISVYHDKIDFFEPLINDADGRNTIEAGDYVYSTKLNRTWAIKKSEVNDSLLFEECKVSLKVLGERLQCVYVNGNKAIPVNNAEVLENGNKMNVNRFYYVRRSEKAVRRANNFDVFFSFFETTLGMKLIAIAHMVIAMTATVALLYVKPDGIINYLVAFGVLAIAFLGCMWLLIAPLCPVEKPKA